MASNGLELTTGGGVFVAELASGLQPSFARSVATDNLDGSYLVRKRDLC